MNLLTRLDRWADRYLERSLISSRIPEPRITTSYAPAISPSRSATSKWWPCCTEGCCTDPCPEVTIGHLMACDHQRETS